MRNIFWIMTMVVVLLFSTIYATASETGKDGRFVAYDNGTVLDKKTNLMWAARDNGADIDWATAKAYCKDCRVGGYKDWRMPTQKELAILYDSTKSHTVECDDTIRIHFATELIDITCLAPWISETRGTDAAWFNLVAGKVSWDPKSTKISGRVIPVRSGKQ